MHLGGELDGQARFARLAFPAMESAACSNEFGKRFSPLANHALFLALTIHVDILMRVFKPPVAQMNRCHTECTREPSLFPGMLQRTSRWCCCLE